MLSQSKFIIFLPFQQEVREKRDKKASLVLYGRTQHKKCIVIVDDIPISLCINITKPVKMKLYETEKEVQQIVLKEVSGLTFQYKIEKYFPFHEYSRYEHSYLRLNFQTIQDYQKFIRDFQNNVLTINSENSYLSEDEMISNYDIKLCREYNFSCCDFNIVTFYDKKEETDCDIYLCKGIDNIQAIDQNYLADYDPKLVLPIQVPEKELIIAFFDIETYSSSHEEVKVITSKTEQNKSSNIADNAIPFVISVSFYKSNEKQPFANFGLSTCKFDLENMQNKLLYCRNEEYLLKTFCQLLKTFRPDIISGFNDNSFDWVVLNNRIAKYDEIKSDLLNALSLDSYLIKLGFNPKYQLFNFVRKEVEVKIDGALSMKCNRFLFAGCLSIDTMIQFRKMYPQDKEYSLNFFLGKFKQQLKDDVGYAEMERYRVESLKQPDKKDNLVNMKKVIDYCINDSISCGRLWIVRNLLLENQELAKMTKTNLECALFKAGGTKVRNTLISYALRYRQNIAISNTKRGSKKEKFSGAMVFPVENNLNRKYPIAVLDFNSLYPNIMSSYNLSPEKVILDESNDFDSEKYDAISHTVIIDDIEKTGILLRHKQQKENFGLVPEVLQVLFRKRKGIQKQHEDLEQREYLDIQEQILKSVLNSQQYSLKIILNTFYGEFGNQLSPICNCYIAACVTSFGKELIGKVRDFTQERNFEVIYGDSIQRDEPLLLRHQFTGEIYIKTIETLTNEYFPYGEEKEQGFTMLEIWTSQGWREIQRIVRHKSTKQMYRVLSHQGVIDISEDHSLITEDGKPIKPSECIIGKTKLFQNYPQLTEEVPELTFQEVYDEVYNFNSNPEFLQQKMFIWGYFYSDGSGGKYETKYGIKYNQAINNQDLNLLYKTERYLKNVYGKYIDFKVLDILKSSEVYKLVPKGHIKYMVDEFRSKFYDKDKYKTVPLEVLNGTYDMKKWFFMGYFTGNCTKFINNKHKLFQFANKGKIGCAQLYFITKSLGLKCSINDINKKPKIFTISSCKKFKKVPNMVKKVIKLPSQNEYIYDIETDCDNFLAGIGEIIGINTDSCFIHLNKTEIDKQYDLQLGNQILWPQLVDETIQKTKILLSDLNHFLIGLTQTEFLRLSYEKSLFPYIQFSKKRYCAIMHGDKNEFNFDHPEKQKIMVKGLQTKKKGNAGILKIMGEELFIKLLGPNNFDNIYNLIKEILHQYFNDEYILDNIENFKITEVFRQGKKNVKINTFIELLPSGYKIDNLAQFDYVFIQKSQYDQSGYKVNLRKGQQMVLFSLYDETTMTLDIRCYLTGSIKGMMISFLELETHDKKLAKQSYKELISEYEKSYFEERLLQPTIKKEFKDFCAKIVISMQDRTTFSRFLQMINGKQVPLIQFMHQLMQEEIVIPSCSVIQEQLQLWQGNINDICLNEFRNCKLQLDKLILELNNIIKICIIKGNLQIRNIIRNIQKNTEEHHIGIIMQLDKLININLALIRKHYIMFQVLVVQIEKFYNIEIKYEIKLYIEKK